MEFPEAKPRQAVKALRGPSIADATPREHLEVMLTALLSGLLMAAPLTLQGPGRPAQVHTLDDARWNHRVLLVFPSEDRHAWAEQQRLVDEARDALESRDILVVMVGDTQAPVRLPDAAAARARWKVGAHEGAAVLVGKDGGEKWRAPLPAPLAPVFSLVDRMPMRQEELRERSLKP